MKLPTFKKKDEIPKGFEDLFEEKNGEWVAKASDTERLEGTVETLRGEKKELEKKLKVADDKSSDLQRKLDVAESGKGDEGKKTKELLEKWEKDTAAAVKVVQDQLDAATTKIETFEVDDKLKAAFLAAGGRPEKSAAALELNKRHFGLVDGKLVKKDAEGKVSTEKVEDHFKATFKKDMPEFYQGTKATGGGAGGGAGGKPLNTDPAAAEKVIKNPLAMLQEANEAALSK